MKTVTIYEKEYPIEYTVEAQNKVAEKGGGLKKVRDVLTNSMPFVLAVMMQAAFHRGQVFGKMSGVEYDGPEPLTEDEISAILMPRDMQDVVEIMVDVINEANKSDVEVTPDKKTGKKTKGMPSE